MTIDRRNHGKGHSYKVDGRKMPGVTTILGATMPKQALINWAAETTANYAVDNWDDLGTLAPSKRLKELLGARFADRDQAANRGTEVHAMAEAYIRGEDIDVPLAIDGHVRQYEAFVADQRVTPVEVEVVVANRAVGYCGTVDLVADVDGRRKLVDLKTSRSGIFPETALQTVAYANAEVYLGQDEQEHPMSELGIVDIAALHVTADGWSLVPILNRGEIWTYFRHLAWLYYRLEDQPTWLGNPVRGTAGARERASA
jgi:hypothetical protein